MDGVRNKNEKPVMATGKEDAKMDSVIVISEDEKEGEMDNAFGQSNDMVPCKSSRFLNEKTGDSEEKEETLITIQQGDQVLKVLSLSSFQNLLSDVKNLAWVMKEYHCDSFGCLNKDQSSSHSQVRVTKELDRNSAREFGDGVNADSKKIASDGTVQDQEFRKDSETTTRMVEENSAPLGSLQSHMTPEEPENWLVYSKNGILFQCVTCHKVFSNRGYLRRHVNMMHKELLKYECNVCHEKFVARSDLKVHLETHADQRPYRCMTCFQRFSSESTLRIHISIYHPCAPNVC